MKSQLFQTLVSDGVPRRAFLFMPFAFAGLMAVGAPEKEARYFPTLRRRARAKR